MSVAVVLGFNELYSHIYKHFFKSFFSGILSKENLIF